MQKVGCLIMVNNTGDVWTQLVHMAEELNRTDIPWLVGGSTACLLQNVPLTRKPNDLDIYTDRRFIDSLKQALAGWNIVAVHNMETERYSSYLSRCRVDTLDVEFSADLTVRTEHGQYDVEVGDLLAKHKIMTIMNDVSLPLIPLEHEMVFNLLRERSDRFRPISDTLKKRGVNGTLWHALQQRNELSDSFWKRAGTLVGLANGEGER